MVQSKFNFDTQCMKYRFFKFQFTLHVDYVITFVFFTYTWKQKVRSHSHCHEYVLTYGNRLGSSSHRVVCITLLHGQWRNALFFCCRSDVQLHPCLPSLKLFPTNLICLAKNRKGYRKICFDLHLGFKGPTFKPHLILREEPIIYHSNQESALKFLI